VTLPHRLSSGSAARSRAADIGDVVHVLCQLATYPQLKIRCHYGVAWKTIAGQRFAL